jgi:CRP-like cAMP-binding protein
LNHINRDKRLVFALSAKFFDALDPEIGRFIVENSRHHTYPAQNIIFQQEDMCDHVTIIISGSISLSIFSEEGKEVIVSEKGPGDILGEVEMVLDCPRLTNGTTTIDTHALTLSRATFATLLDRPAFAKAMLKLLSRYMRETLTLTESLAIHSLETRLARLLTSMGRSHGRPVGDGILIDRVVSQGRLGQMINASRPKINAQLRAWQSRKLILLRGGRITILDPAALRLVSQLPD